MNILIEGPRWSGQWTEIVADSLQQLGHRVDYCYHNHKGLSDRISLAGKTLLGQPRQHAWEERYRQQLLQRWSKSPTDLFISIQGKVNSATINQLRKHSPTMKVIYWWGDILTEKGELSIREAATFADRLLVSYAGCLEKLKPLYGEQIDYFPFGVSERFHSAPRITEHDKKRFTADVSFVGTCYPERCALIEALNVKLKSPVRVWGRGWRHCRPVTGQGALSLQDSLEVHACSKISLNLHHRDTDNGCNMKFYEIPAAGGFQLCDAQPVMTTTALGKSTITCQSPDEFADRINYYLTHEDKRQQLADSARQTVFETARYTDKFAELLNSFT